MASNTFSPPRLWSSSKPGSSTIQLCSSTKRTLAGSTSGWASHRLSAIAVMSDHFMAWPSSMIFFSRVVDGVFRNLHHQVFVGHDGLAGQARHRFQAPGLVQHVFFLFFRLVQGCKALAHEHVAGGAGADAVAGVFDLDVVFQHDVADGFAFGGFEDGAFGEEYGMRKNNDLGHKNPFKQK